MVHRFAAKYSSVVYIGESRLEQSRLKELAIQLQTIAMELGAPQTTKTASVDPPTGQIKKVEPISTGIPDNLKIGLLDASVLKTQPSVKITRDDIVIKDQQFNGKIDQWGIGVEFVNCRFNANDVFYSACSLAFQSKTKFTNCEFIGECDTAIEGENFFVDKCIFDCKARAAVFVTGRGEIKWSHFSNLAGYSVMIARPAGDLDIYENYLGGRFGIYFVDDIGIPQGKIQILKNQARDMAIPIADTKGYEHIIAQSNQRI